MSEHPTCFISYSWDSETHKDWVRNLATRLRQDGVDVTLDQWHAVPGDQLPQFMERAVRENDFVLIICTEEYLPRANERRGGVGYEGDIITGEAFILREHRKFIPILRQGKWKDAAPSFLMGKFYIDLSSDPYSEAQYERLLKTLLNMSDSPPPLGPIPWERIKQSEDNDTSSRETWLQLEYGSFPHISDSDAARTAFSGTLRAALIETLDPRHTTRFAFTLRRTFNESPEGKYTMYEVWSHQSTFIAAAAEAHERLLRKSIAASLSDDRAAARDRLRREISEQEDALSAWKLEAQLDFDKYSRAHWVTFDPQAKRIKIESDLERSADPKDYDNKVGTTSEALVYACALGSNPIAFIGDIGWMLDRPNLLKLTTFMLDTRTLDYSNFRFLASDIERWDFRNPKLEAELQGYS
jgi:hypothetical protein